MKVLEFIFQSFWHFIWTVVLIYVVGEIIIKSIIAIKNKID